jgi:hypothetical protein
MKVRNAALAKSALFCGGFVVEIRQGRNHNDGAMDDGTGMLAAMW